MKRVFRQYIVLHDEDAVHSARALRIGSSDSVVKSHLFLKERKRHVYRNDGLARNIGRLSIGWHVTIDTIFLIRNLVPELDELQF